MTKPKRGKNLKRWELLALLHGYNELARLSKVLGEKVFFRLHCQTIEKLLAKDYGVVIPHTETPGSTILVLGHRAPFVIFHERDIELMRAAVKKHDGDDA